MKIFAFPLRVYTPGSLEGALSGSQCSRAWRIHLAISKALIGLLFTGFKNETASHISNEAFNIACKDDNLITEEEIKILLELDMDYESNKISVKGITLRFSLYH